MHFDDLFLGGVLIKLCRLLIKLCRLLIIKLAGCKVCRVNVVYVFLVTPLLRFCKSGGGRAGAQPPVTSRE